MNAGPLSSRRTDVTVRREMPYPIAAAWHRVSVCISDSDRCDRLLGCYEITLRTLAAFLLPDYLRGEQVPKVEAAIRKLSRPTCGQWIELIRELLKALPARSEPVMFAPEAAAWFSDGADSTVGTNAKLLYDINTLRNRIVHGGPSLSADHARERANELLSSMRQLLRSMRWMTGCRAFRVLEMEPTRSRTFRGRIQFLVGHVELNEPVFAEWEASLLKSSVYLADPSGEHLLELFPFLQVLGSKTQQEHCFLFREVQGLKRLVMVHDASGAEKTLGFTGDQGELSFTRWLEQRSALHSYHPNRDHGKTLRCPVADLAPDEELGSKRFRVIGLLGDGGMGKVWRVHDREFDEEAALKVLDAKVADDPVFRERFKREARTMNQINHPSILSSQEFGTLESGRMFLKMPVADGGNLRDRIQPGGLPEDQVLPLARQMLRAQVHLHSLKIIHRDIKPSNFLFNEAGELLLSDFGIALSEKDTHITRTLEQMGTLAYMAPEQRTGKGVTFKVDLYSTALILHELLTGEQVASNPGKKLPGKLGRLIRNIGAESPDHRSTATEALSMIEERRRSRGKDGGIAPTTTSTWHIERSGEFSHSEISDELESSSDANTDSPRSSSWRRLHNTGPHNISDPNTETVTIDVDHHSSWRLPLVGGGIALLVMVVVLVIGLRELGETGGDARNSKYSKNAIPPKPMRVNDGSTDNSFSAPWTKRPLRIGVLDRPEFWRSDKGQEMAALTKALSEELSKIMKRKVQVQVMLLQNFMQLADRLVTSDPEMRIDLGRFSAIKYVLAKGKRPQLRPVVIQESINPENALPTAEYYSVLILKCRFFKSRSLELGRICRSVGTHTDTRHLRDRARLRKLFSKLDGRSVCLTQCLSSSGFVYPLYHLHELGLTFSQAPQYGSNRHPVLAKKLVTNKSCALGAVYSSIIQVTERAETIEEYQKLLDKGMQDGDIKVITIPEGIPKDVYVTSNKHSAPSLKIWRLAFSMASKNSGYRAAIKKVGKHVSRISNHRVASDAAYNKLRQRICGISSVLAKTTCRNILTFQRKYCKGKRMKP